MTFRTSLNPRTGVVAVAVVGAVTIVPLAVAATSTAQAAPASQQATTYTAASSATYPYAAKGVSASITITRQADQLYKVTIAGSATTSGPITVPASTTSGLMATMAPQRMAGNNGTMTRTPSTATFTFDKAYLRDYQAPFTFGGTWQVVVTTGQSSTQTITVGGHTYPIVIQAPAVSASAYGQGHRIMQRRVFEIDNATLRNGVVDRAYYRADDDNKLTKTELARLYTEAANKPFFHESHVFRTVWVPKDATKTEELAALNAVLPKGWAKLTSLAHQSATGKPVTTKTPDVVVTVWELDVVHGAKPKDGGDAFGPHGTLAETYVASSNHR